MAINEVRYLGLEQLLARYSVSKATWYRWVARGDAPPPVDLPGEVRWSTVMLDEWDAEREELARELWKTRRANTELNQGAKWTADIDPRARKASTPGTEE